jgi:5,10-methylenetetrahydromethanopterin reductase
MRYGLLLLGEHTPDRLLRLARLAEENDFEHIWYADEKFYRDPYASLTFLSQHTSRIKLGTCVTDPYTRHPAITTMAMATMDEYAAGRGVLGIGAGFSGLEAMGIERTRVVTKLRESIELIRRLWAGESLTYDGETTTFRNGELNFKTRSDIPIAIASAGRQILRLAGEVADEVMLGDLASPEVINKAIKEVEIGAGKAQRSLSDIYLITRVNLIISDDVKAASDIMRPWITGDLWGVFPNWKSMFTYKPEWDELLGPLKEFIDDYGGRPRNVGDFALIAKYNHLVTDEMVKDKALVGKVDDIVDQIVKIAGTGVQEVTMYPLPLPDQDIESVLSVFLEEIKPRVDEALVNV